LSLFNLTFPVLDRKNQCNNSNNCRENRKHPCYPNTICECIRQVFEITADKKIERLYMPVLGSGHGGLDINDAMLFFILSLKYYSKTFHHIKTVDIMVMGSDVKKLKDINRLII